MYFEMRKVRTDVDVPVDTAQKRALESWGMRSPSAVMEQRQNSSPGGHAKKVKNPVKT